MKIQTIRNSLGTFAHVTFRRPGKTRNTVAFMSWRDGAREQEVYFFAESQRNPGYPDTEYPDDFIPTWCDYCNTITVSSPEDARDDLAERIALKAVALALRPWAGELIDKAQELYTVMDSGRAQSTYARELMQEVQADMQDAGLEFTAATMATLGVKRYLRFEDKGRAK